MTLSELFTAHLRSPSRHERGLVAALERAGLDVEASAYRAWCVGSREIKADGAWFGQHVTIASAPPKPRSGELWFDICELALMIYGGRAWIATRPTARWQMHGFLDVSSRAPRIVQVAPPYRALDPARLTAGAEFDRCTNVTPGEATLYAWWFGKMLPHRFDWLAAAKELAAPAMDALWTASTKEWSATRLDQDEAARISVMRSTCDVDPLDLVESEVRLPPAERVMIRGEYTRESDVGMRTAVHGEIGLFETISKWNMLAEDVRLTSLLDRSRFR